MKKSIHALTQRLAPMLAGTSPPFDDPEYLFEIKWDGVRAMTLVQRHGIRMWGRDMQDYTDRYPELQFLGQLPVGTTLDGELVVPREGRPDFQALMARHRSRLGRPRSETIQYIVFDLLACGGRSLLNVPFGERRSMLRAMLPKHPLLRRCEGVRGLGEAFFQKMISRGHEGIVAKRLNAPYTPGKRTSAWRKIKQVMDLACLIVGYRTDAKDIRTLFLATMLEGKLAYAGAVELGIPQEMAFRRALIARHRASPAIPGLPRARWLDPTLLCVVRFHGYRPNGSWRDPVFRAWME